jgi:hypothetical protein
MAMSAVVQASESLVLLVMSFLPVDLLRLPPSSQPGNRPVQPAFIQIENRRVRAGQFIHYGYKYIRFGYFAACGATLKMDN